MKKTLTTTAFGALVLFGFSQNQYYELPVYLGQFFNDPQINQANQSVKKDFHFTIGHKRNTNDFGGINTSLLSFSYKLKAKNENNFGVVGGNFASDKEGFLIRRNRGYGFYARHLKLNNTYSMAASLSLGFYNFAVKANETTGGFSAAAFDGTGSLALYSEKANIGFSINQFANSKLQPIDQTIVLVRHYSLLASYEVAKTKSISLSPIAYGRYSPIESNMPTTGLFASAGARALFQNVIMGGVSWETNNGFYFFLGVENLTIGNGSGLNATFSYFTPSGKIARVNIQQFELTASYFFNKQKENE